MVIAMMFGAALSPYAFADETGAWAQEHFSKARLLGSLAAREGDASVIAGVEIVLDKGWKTYWRQPGDEGGVPPVFDWSGSLNVASVEVLFPAPERFRGLSSSSIGYRNRVIFPVRVIPKRRSEPVRLKLNLRYGLCSSICVPVQASLDYSLDNLTFTGLSEALRSALARVPVEVRDAATSENVLVPRISRYAVKLDGAEPHILVEAQFPRGSQGTDIFVEVSGGMYLPMARRRPAVSKGTYVIDLSDVDDRSQLEGQTLSVTMVSSAGNTIEHITLD